MKPYKIKKRKDRPLVFIENVIEKPPKPKFPLKLFLNVHELKGIVEFVFDDETDEDS